MKELVLIGSFLIAHLFLTGQEYVIQIELKDVYIVEECHFGDEWKAYFSFGGEYMYEDVAQPFILSPSNSFGLKSMIFEGNEVHNDYAETISKISHDDLKAGRYTLEELLYVEDENTGRYHCNNATFKFDYIISVTVR